MMIFTMIAGAIATALFAGSTLAATLIAGALAFGTQLAISYLTRPKARKYSAVQGTVQFGGDIDVGALYGTSLVKGQRIYYAKHGKGNKYNSEVFVLSNGWCDGLEPEVYFYGKKHKLKLVGGSKVTENWNAYASHFPLINSLAAFQDAINSWDQYTQKVLNPLSIVLNGILQFIRNAVSTPRAAFGQAAEVWQVAGFDGKITLRFFDGRPGQMADNALVANTARLNNPWLSTDVCAGMTYVVVEREWDEKLFDQGRPEFGFILRGLREYDFRHDDTVAGGSGPQRLDDSSTWVHTQNPAVHRLNYQLGLRGLISGRAMIGEGKSLGQLDLGSYTAAMNVCDTSRNGKPTYQCSLYVTGADDHTEVLREFDDAMAGYGMNRRGLSGIIAGAPQVPVMTITSDDLDAGRAKQIKRRKSAFDLYNYISGQYISRANQWTPESLTPITVNADVAADGRARQTSNDFLQVTDPDIAQYLLQIRYRQNRLGGTATLPVSRRLGFRVVEGEWVTYDGTQWLITNWNLSEKLEVTLTLAETSANVYSSAGIIPGPIVIPVEAPINPSIVSTVADFNVEVGEQAGADGEQVPTLRFTWDPPDDPTITAVRFFYFGNDRDTEIYEDQTTDVEAGVYTTDKNVRGGVFYTARATITTVPDRFKIFTPWLTTATVTSPSIFPVGAVSQIQGAVKDLLDGMQSGIATNAQDLITEALARVQGLQAEALARNDQINAERDERLVNDGLYAGHIRDLVETVGQQSLRIDETAMVTARNQTIVRQEVADSAAGSRAYTETQIELAVGPNSALAAKLLTLAASIAGVDTELGAAVTQLTQAIADGDAGSASALEALKLQVRGSYAGGDLSQVTEGLLYQLNQARLTDNEALATAIALVSAGIGILYDSKYLWSYDTSVEGWTGNGTPTASGGYLRPANHATDPYVVSPSGLDVVATSYRQIKAYVRKTGSPVWEGQAWYKRTGDTTWDAARRATIAEPVFDVAGRAVITWDMDWDGTIDQIRLDLSTAQTDTDYYRIDWSGVGRPSPGASRADVANVQEALTTAIAAEASRRETLSTILVGQADPTGVTLPTAGGLIRDERNTRAAADEALSTSIIAVQARIENPTTGLDALAGAQSTMRGDITAIDGRVNTNATNIANAFSQLDDKAGVGVTNSLKSQIEEIGGGDAMALFAQALRSLQSSVSQQALNQAGLFLDREQQRNELAGATASVQQAMENKIAITDGQVDVIGKSVVAIQLALGDYAKLTLTDALSGRITATETGIEQIGESLVVIDNALAGKANASVLNDYYTKTETDGVASTAASNATTALSSSLTPQIAAALDAAGNAQDTADAAGSLASTKADASVVSTMSTKVDNQGGQITSLSDLVNSMSATVGEVSASGKFRVSTQATSAGAQSTIGLIAEAVSGAASHSAAILLDAMSDGKSRAVLIGDQVVVMNGGEIAALFQEGTVFFDNGRFRNLTGDIFKAGSIDAGVVMERGTIITDLIATDQLTGKGFDSNTVSGSLGSLPGSWRTCASFTCINPNPNPPLLFYRLRGSLFLNPSAGSISMSVRFVRKIGTSIKVLNDDPVSLDVTTAIRNRSVDTKTIFTTDPDAPKGTYTYEVQYNITNNFANASLSTFSVTGDISGQWAKR